MEFLLIQILNKHIRVYAGFFEVYTSLSSANSSVFSQSTEKQTTFLGICKYGSHQGLSAINTLFLEG